jgi:hypothetical protein
MEFKPNIEQVVERYRDLWLFKELDPPIVMVSTAEAPITTGAHDCIFWQNPDALVEYHLRNLENRRHIRDDYIPMLRPPFSHTALPAALGAEVELLNEKLWARPLLSAIEKYRDLRLPLRNDWIIHMEQYYRRLVELAAGRFAVGLTEVPGPADLMGAMIGFEEILLCLYDAPDVIEGFAGYTAGLGIEFTERVRDLLYEQENWGGCWLAGAWAPRKTIYFCEHASVNYSPEHYERFLAPANRVLLEHYDYALTYIYYSAGKHLSSYYFNRGCPAWVRSCDENPPPELVESYRGHSIVTINTNAADFDNARRHYGNAGICYAVECDSLEDAADFCASIGLR